MTPGRQRKRGPDFRPEPLSNTPQKSLKFDARNHTEAAGLKGEDIGKVT